MRSKFEDLYDQAWRQEAGAAPTTAVEAPVAAFDRRIPSETFQKLEARVRDVLGPRVKGLVPFLDKARGLVLGLFPAGGPSQIHGPERIARHEELAAVLDKIEDLFQALQLASHTR